MRDSPGLPLPSMCRCRRRRRGSSSTLQSSLNGSRPISGVTVADRSPGAAASSRLRKSLPHNLDDVKYLHRQVVQLSDHRYHERAPTCCGNGGRHGLPVGDALTRFNMHTYAVSSCRVLSKLRAAGKLGAFWESTPLRRLQKRTRSRNVLCWVSAMPVAWSTSHTSCLHARDSCTSR